MFNIVSPDCLRHVLKDDFNNYEKGKLSKSLLELFGEATFTTDGDEWKFHRRIAVFFFEQRSVKLFRQNIIAEAQRIGAIF